MTLDFFSNILHDPVIRFFPPVRLTSFWVYLIVIPLTDSDFFIKSIVLSLRFNFLFLSQVSFGLLFITSFLKRIVIRVLHHLFHYLLRFFLQNLFWLLIILVWNTLFGLATQLGSREYTIDLTEMISGSSSYYYPAFHFDPVSILLIFFFLILLTSTRPFDNKEE